jgi:hypothetical protein
MSKRKSTKTRTKTHGGMTYKQIALWGGGAIAFIALLYFM